MPHQINEVGPYPPLPRRCSQTPVRGVIFGIAWDMGVTDNHNPDVALEAPSPGAFAGESYGIRPQEAIRDLSGPKRSRSGCPADPPAYGHEQSSARPRHTWRRDDFP